MLYSNEIRDYSYFSMLYFFLCLLVLFIPLVYHSGLLINYPLSKQFVRIFSIIVIISGFLNIYYNLSTHTLAEIVIDFGAARAEYYENTDGTGVQTNPVFWLAINLFPLLFFALPLSFYNFSRKKKKQAILLLIASFAFFTHAIVEASRQELFLWIGNAVISFLMYRDAFSTKTKVVLYSTLGVVGVVLVVLIGLITFSRFGGDGEGDVLASVFGYFGSQPFNAASFLELLQSQELWGRANFSTLLGMPYVYQLNDVLNAPIYLNVFGTIVGHFYLDFGYLTLFFCVIYAWFFKRILDYFYAHKCVLYYYVYIIYVNLMFAGLFYNRFNSPGMIKPFTAFGIILFMYDIITHSKRNRVSVPTSVLVKE
jgi:oligosaccharide repeat unit polymerase